MAHKAKASRHKRWSSNSSGLWITARKVAQYAALFSFVVLFVWSRRGGWPANLVNIPMRLDPLLVLSHLLASRAFLISSLLALIVLILTLIFGRAWCGWLCPLGTILDLLPLRSQQNLSKNTRKPGESWRSIKYVLLLAILIAALFGNLTLLVFDPLTIVFRTLTVSLWPALDQVITAIETSLYRLPFFSRPISTFDAWVRPEILPPDPSYYRETLIFGVIFFGVIALNLFAPRFWCRYLCPLGALLGLISKLALFRHEVSQECKGCALCTQSCPTGTIDPSRNYASDPSECTMCLDCLEVCPRSAIVFTPRFSLAEWREYDPGRRQALATMGLTITALALFRSQAHIKTEHPYQLRPPGARENNLLSKCVRCAECMRACPTSALQPAVTESGLEGLWTPLLIPRLGYCDYSCNACGQVCPVQAIPPLDLGTKRAQVIGSAYIDRDRCIAWADHRDCIVCEEMCPIPDKAIYLEPVQFSASDGTQDIVQLPYVDREKCIGCGICEYKCPVNGEAAIQVFIPNAGVPF